jgi:hypothetical protein
MTPERELWSLYEPVHVIVYFEPTVSGCLAADGLHGFWNGYFAGRAAPLGAVGPAPVTALFFGFAPAMVANALPKVWGRITPEQAIETRLAAVDALLSPVLTTGSQDDLRRATDLLARTASEASTDGRALAAGWQGVTPTASIAVRLWWAATVLREHRGDGHVLAATHAGLSGLETTLTHIASGVVTRETMQPNRGWTDEDWAAATERLTDRGILAGDGSLTAAGKTLRADLEAETDRLARSPYVAIADDLPLLRSVLDPIGDALAAAGALPAGNPMGLTR